MWPVSDLWRKALVGPHLAKSRVELYIGSKLIGEVKVIDGSVTDTWPDVAGARRTLSLNTPDRTIEPGMSLKVWHGMQFGTGDWEWIPGGVFPVLDRSLSYSYDSTVSVSCIDRWQWVMGAKFGGPYQMPRGRPVVSEAARLILESGPWGSVIETAVSSARSDSLVYDESRHEAIVDLVKAAGAQAWAGRDGAGLVSNRSTSGPSVVRLKGGPGGTLIDLEASDSWAEVSNVVAARSSSNDAGVAAAVGVQWARITDPRSPIHPSKIGPRVRQYASPLLTTSAQALAAAGTILGYASAASRTLSITCVPDWSLDAGDPITVIDPVTGREEAALIQRIVHPLTNGSQQIDTVDTRPDFEE